MEKRLTKFIKDNKLSFIGADSAVNSSCTIISGFADYLGISDWRDVATAISKAEPEAVGYRTELKRVFEFAYHYNYGNFWKTDEAKKMYKF